MGMFGDTNGRSRIASPAGAMALAGEVADGMEAQTSILHQLLEAIDTGAEQVAITDEARDPVLQKDFPVEGISRWIIHRLATGGAFPIKLARSDILSTNANRFGGTIVNSGSNAVVLFLGSTKANEPGLAQIWLGANGGSWDFRLGNMLWCGNISARCLENVESTLRVVEV